MTAFANAVNETTPSAAQGWRATAPGAVQSVDDDTPITSLQAGQNLEIGYGVGGMGGAAVRVELLQNTTVIKSVDVVLGPDATGTLVVTPAELAGITLPWTPRLRATSL